MWTEFLPLVVVIEMKKIELKIWIEIFWVAKVVFALLLVMPGLFLFDGRAEAAKSGRVFIDIYSPSSRKIRLAIPELRPLEGGRNPIGLKIAQVIEADLQRSGIFFIRNRKGFLENPLKAGIQKKSQRFKQWANVVKVEGLIKGGYKILGNSLEAEMYMYDVVRGVQELGKRYRYPKSNWRLLAHRFANTVLERFTGEKGVFDTQIAFVARRTIKHRGEIYIMDWDGAQLRRVTRNGQGNNAPAWSPDGKWLAYSSFKSRTPGVFILPTNGGREFRVSSGRFQAIGGGFSPDSRYFAFSQLAGRNYEIYRYDMFSRVRKRLTRNFGIDVSPAFSPDGRKIAFSTGRTGTPQIYVMNSDGSNPRRITQKGTYNTEPDWSPRGDRIVFTGRVTDGSSIDIVTINPDGSDLRRLTGGQRRNESPSWSPDGRNIAFSSDRSGRKYVYVMTSAGTQLKRLELGQEPAWSPALP
ncbi:MAG: Tol-Pal system beta propeller repeat protein TolB [Nitrospinaceae bacterium]|nr:Tol-Pal system beta propeller repeat protein TolB [Nitrospinaceae bacterium]